MFSIALLYFRFACDNPEILVQLNDKVNFVCPHKALNQGELDDPANADSLHENAFMLQPNQQEKFHMCDATGTNHCMSVILHSFMLLAYVTVTSMSRS